MLAAFGFDRSDIIEVIDQEATLERLRRLFEHELPERARRVDQLLVYYAGHGHAVPDRAFGVRGFLVPVDATGGVVESFLPTEVVQKACDALSGCNHLLLLLDCCFAGSFGTDLYRDVVADERLARRWFESYDRRRSFQLIASCAHDERALDSFSAKQEREQLGGQHSPFARALLDALGDKLCADVNGDFIVTTSELFSYLQACFAAPGHRGPPQTPNLWHLGWHQGGEFMFVAGEPRFLEPAELAHDANPYRGLEAFRATHHKLFFGRSGLSDQLCARVRMHPLTVVLGPSGSGKSSLVQAGVMAELGKPGGGPDWLILEPFRPGAAPLVTLERAQGRAGLLTTVPAADRLCFPEHPDRRPVLLVVDQLEELVTARAPDAERGLFLLLLELAAHPGSTEEIASALAPAASFIAQLEAATRSAFWRALNALVERRTALRIVATARSEYEPHFLRKVEDTDKMAGPTAAWQARWSDARFWVRRMHREELRECIERPAARLFLRFEIEPRPNGAVTLVDQLLDEVDQMPGGLPLLSVALREMFVAYVDGKRCDATIGWDEYDRVGGATGALHRRADQIYVPAAMASDLDALTRHQDSMRRLLLRMVSLEAGEIARRSVSHAELAFDDDAENTRTSEIRNQLEVARLIVEDRRDDEIRWEPAHDQLVRGWPRLAHWLTGNEALLLARRRLTEATQHWLGRPEGEPRARILWDDARRLEVLPEPDSGERRRMLPRLRAWWGERMVVDFVERGVPPYTFSKAESDFLRASQRVRRRRFIGLAGSICAAFVVLAAAAIIVNVARARATAEAIAAADAKRVGAAHDRVRTDPTIAVELLREVQQPATALSWTQTALEALERPIAEQVFRSHHDEVTTLAFSPDGRLLASGSLDGSVVIVPLDGKGLTEHMLQRGPIAAVRFDGSGRYLAIEYTPPREVWRRLVVWDRSQDKAIIDRPGQHAVFSPDSAMVAATSENDAWFKRIADGDVVMLRGHKDAIEGLAFTADARLVTASDDGTVRVWSTATTSGTQLCQIGRLNEDYPDPKQLALQSGISQASAVSLIGLQMAGRGSNVTAFAINHARDEVVTGHLGGAIQLWRVSPCDAEPTRLAGDEQGSTDPGDQVSSVDYLAPERFVVAGYARGSVGAWPHNQGHPHDLVHGATSSADVESVSGLARGNRLLLLNRGRAARVGIVLEEEGERPSLGPQLLRVDWPGIVTAIMDETGSFVAAGDRVGFVRVWRIASPSIPAEVEDRSATAMAAFADTGEWLATAVEDASSEPRPRRIRVRRIRELADQGKLLPRPYPAGVALAVSSNPPRVFVASAVSAIPVSPGLVRGVSSAIEVWDLQSALDTPSATIKDLDLSITRLAVDRTGSLLAAATNRGPRVWALRDAAWKSIPTHVARSTASIAVSPDGGLVAAGVSDTVIVSELDHDKLVEMTRLGGHQQFAWSLAFSNDGRRLATGDWGATVRLFTFGDPYPLLLTGHRRLVASKSESKVIALSFSSDGRFLISAVRNGSVLLHDAIGPSPETALEDPDVLAVQFFAGGVATVGRNSVRTWPVSVEQLQALLAHATTADLTREEHREILGETEN